MKNSFRLNQWVCYPGHGVGQIIKAEQKEVFGLVQEFFTIELTSNMKIMMPSANTKQVGLRKLLSKNQINKVFAEVKAIPVIRENRWEKRYRAYMEQIRTGQFIDVVTVLKQLNAAKGEFDLSFGERKLLDEAMTLAIEEVSLAHNVHKDEAETIVTNKLGV